MPWNPNAISFIPRSMDACEINIKNSIIKAGQQVLSSTDSLLFHTIIDEWHSSLLLSSCLDNWELISKPKVQLTSTFLYTLCFNVRGLDLRWGEVYLLFSSYNVDIMVLLEVGKFDQDTIVTAFPNHFLFYQEGENAHGGVLILVRQTIPVTRVPCHLANVCVVDLHLDETLRLIGMYAPDKRSWSWNDLSSFFLTNSIICGDFNVDLTEDGDKADRLLKWADDLDLSPVVPDTRTSLRSDRTIDYAFAKGTQVAVQVHEGATTSDHKPIILVSAVEDKRKNMASRTSWPVFSLFLSYVFPFWEKQWSASNMNETYNNFTRFLSLLTARCTRTFPLKLARPAIPPELRSKLSYSRALSFKAKRTGDMKLKIESAKVRNDVRRELRLFQQNQLAKQLSDRNKSVDSARMFWSKTKKHFRKQTAVLRGFNLSSGQIESDATAMVQLAADYYEKLFEEPSVTRPHPYTDSPLVLSLENNSPIPDVTYADVLKVVKTRKKKRSCDIHGISSYLLNQLPDNYWHFMVKLYNHSFSTYQMPDKFKDVRIILLAKKDAICPPEQTRPISLIDSFLKIQERLYLNRFMTILENKGLIPESQSGFLPGRRL
ncbi:unnamed protein product [Rotaria magnacalcarata]|uniref:Endonuclease/exonuclease/phosphatase domain-containing protein n=1 Tax=Rotaria magnacalcarata TaxID=392030 RepID=A0A820KPY1_9BILA|nr:unnamed protein product [Rotaria magnacalcarata]